MAKKTVILTPQERFDLIDALALQQGSIDYVGQVIGNLMGASSGLLSFASFEANGDTISMGSKRFAFYVSSGSLIESNGQLQPAASQDRVGEVVVYDPSAPQQQIQQLDFSTAKAAYDAHAAQQVDRGIDLNTGVQLIFDPTATPFIWARGIPVSGQEDARRKWSIAQQVEVPVTMKTRVLTQVEFALSPTMPSPTHARSEDLGGAEAYIPWAPIARIIDFEGNLPVITPISAFDSAAWEERLRDKYDLDPRNGSTFIDWYSGEIPSLTSKEFFGDYQRPMGPAVSPMVSLITRLELSQNVDLLGQDFPLTDQLKLLSDVLGNRPNDESSLDGLRHLGHNFKKDNSFSCWAKSKVDGSVGIADQLAGIKAVIQSITSSGLYEYGGDIVLDKRVAPFKNDDEDLRNLWTALAENKKSGWNAKPIRSLNSLALENMIQKEELESLRKEIDALRQDHDTLREEHDNLQTDFDDQDDPFSSVPINDAQPLVPALSLTFHASYGVGSTGFNCYAGPENALESVSLFVRANMYSQISYARGGVRIQLSPECIDSLGGISAVSRGQVTIHATPIHNANSSPWLFPGNYYGVGKLDNQASHEGGADHFSFQGESLRKSDSFQVLNAFANFYQCTLNVILFPDQSKIEVYPVNTVPDIVENGHDLRGYPAFGGWVGRISNDDEQRGTGTWNDATIQTLDTQNEDFAGGGTAFGFLHGDVTNPDIYRNRAGGSDVSDGNYVTDLSKAEVFGHQDDLRGFAQSVTFLRPDRFSFGVEDTIAAPLFDARHNAPETHILDDGSEDVPARNLDELDVRGGNGRFIPSFSLTIYKNSFTSLGSSISDAQTSIPIADFDIRYNDSEIPDVNGNVVTTGDTSTKGGS